jgi:hypothetical protein
MDELDNVLNTIPQVNSVRDAVAQGKIASVYFDVTGALVILFQEGGALKLDENHIDYLQADGLVEAFNG